MHFQQANVPHDFALRIASSQQEFLIIDLEIKVSTLFCNKRNKNKKNAAN